MAGQRDAEQAHAAAEAEIARVAAAGGDKLDLSDEAFHALARIPESLRQIKGLREINLGETAVSDLSPLRGLTGLQELRLFQTGVNDLAPLRGLTGLQQLSLGETAVRDRKSVV